MGRCTVIVYTTAPADYDWFGTHTVKENVGATRNGKTVRKVEIPVGTRTDNQIGRYQSGLHMAVDQTEWDKLVGYELATVHP